MFKQFFIGTVILLFSGQSFAKNAVQALLEEKSDKTPFEILREYFSSISYSPNLDISSLNQFDYTTQTSISKFNRCVAAYSNNQNLSEANLRILSYTKFIPGIPSNGPLFPGKPDQHVVINGCSLNNDFSGVLTYRAERILDEAFLGYETDGSLVCNTRNSDSSDYFKTAGMHIKLSNDNLASFRTSLLSYDGNYVEGYGYCWNE